MTVYKNETVVEEFPAGFVVERAEDYAGPWFNLVAGDKVRCGLSYKYLVSSVVSYALEYNRDPVKAYNDAVERGHDTHFLVPLGSTISASKMPREKWIKIKDGDHVKFEGKVFRITKPGRYENHFSLVELSEKELEARVNVWKARKKAS